MLMAGLAAATGIWGQRTGSQDLIRLSRRSVYASTALITLAVVVLMALIFSNDFLVRMVQTSSSRSLPWHFKITLLWVDLESSILFWAWILSLASALAVRLHHKTLPDLTPHATAVLMMVLGFFLYLLLFQKTPFDEYLVETPLIGNGMRPMLRNPWMLFHPPAQYLGYIGTTVPFAYCVAALIRPSRTGQDEDDWLRIMRPWIITTWIFLGIGLVLGMLWAYGLIDWGGWWGWDPIENASLFPWLTATALLHAALASLRRGGLLRGWTVFLVLLTFWLTILGTFMTRSGIVRSVHSFGEDKGLFWAFVIFMGLGAASFGLMITRLLEGRFSTRRIWGFFSLEFFFVLTSWVMLLATFVVLAGTLYPTIHEAIYDTRVTVGAPFFERFMAPLGITMLTLMAVAPLMSWRPMKLTRFLEQCFWPFLVMVAVMIGLPVFWSEVFPYMQTIRLGGYEIQAPGVSLVQLTIGLSAFTLAAVLQQYLRLVAVRARLQSESFVRSMGTVFTANRARYAAHIVHIGVALMFLGFAGKPLVKHGDRVLAPGDVYRIAGVELQYHSLTSRRGADTNATQALILKREPGRAWAETLTPGTVVYHESPSMPVNEVSIVRRLGRDVHVRLADQRGNNITLKVAVHPLVSWLWLGFIVMVIGAVIGLAGPRRRKQKRQRRRPPKDGSEASRVSRLVLFVVGALAAAWLLALGYYLAIMVPETETSAALSIWVVGAAAVGVAATLVFTFLPTALASQTDSEANETTREPVADDDVVTTRLVQELQQIEEDRSLHKLTNEAARAMALPIRRDLAIAMATADAEGRRDGLAESLTHPDAEQGDKS
jgi:cytochrome c-type biogenesis protein CcmF